MQSITRSDIILLTVSFMNQQTLSSIQQNFLSELLLAEQKKKTSLPFIKHRTPSSPLVSDGETFQVMTIGGTIFRKALVKNINGTLKIVQRETKNQPPLLNKEDLLLYVEKELQPTTRVLALNFAYAMTPVFERGRLDGVLLHGSKENALGDMVGKKVGEEIEKYIVKKHKRDIVVSVANDAVCLLLSGLTRFPWETLAGGIVGTGVNFAIFMEEKEIVNLESANFDKFPQSLEGKLIDKYSSYPGNAIFEKETAGAYLYRHFNIVREAMGSLREPLHSTQELDQIAQLPHEESALARRLIQYSALLVATQIAGVLKFKKKDLTFVVEGSLFWFADMYRTHIKKYLKTTLPEYKAEFVRIPDSTMLGAAKLVT